MSAAPSARPAPFSEPNPPTWEQQARAALRRTRRADLEKGVQVRSRYAATPCPCSRVTDAHSPTEQKIYAAMQAIGRGEFNRSPRPGQAPTIGRQNDKEYDYTVHVSMGALGFLAGQLAKPPEPALPVSTVQYNLKNLAQKHSVIPIEVRRPGDKEASNREASVFRLPHWQDVLDARRADPQIATTHGSADPKDSLQWHIGRSNSHRLLSPEEAVEWKIEQVVPAKTKHSSAAAKETSTSPAAAPAERPSEVATPGATPKAAAKPTAGIKEKLSIEVAYRFEGQYETLSIQDWLSKMCGGFCDIAAEILSNAERTAADHDPPREMPIKGALYAWGNEGVIECCDWAIEKIRRPVNGRRVAMFKGSPAKFLSTCMLDQAHVHHYLDKLEDRADKARKKAARAHEECRDALAMHRRKPTLDTYGLLSSRLDLLAENDPLRGEVMELLLAVKDISDVEKPRAP